jgi:AraC-like DNA-binding protein
MISVLSISTDRVPQRERYAYWREAVSSQYTGMSTDCSKAERERFWARLAGSRRAGSTLLNIERSGVLTHRATKDIERFPNDNLLIYSAPATHSLFRPHDGQEFVAAPASIVIGYADVAFSHVPVNGVDYACRLASLPVAPVGSFRRSQRRPLPKVIAADCGIGRLLVSYFDAWSSNFAALEGEALDLATQTLAQLAALAHGSADTSHELSRDAVVAGQFAAAERFIARNFHRPELSPALAAATLGISVRRLHLLFEPTGASFSRRVLALRLAKAQDLLAAHPTLPVTEIAFRCGFDNLATFYRTFKTAFHMTATEFRAAARERRR